MTSQALIDYINQVREWAEGCCAPVFYRDDTDQQHNGSMTFVDTGQEILGITAGHVADSIIKHCDSRPGHGCQVGSADLDPNRLIARHQDLDLATFRLSTPFVTTASKHTVTIPSWPPRAPSLGVSKVYLTDILVCHSELQALIVTVMNAFRSMLTSVAGAGVRYSELLRTMS